MKKGTMVGIRLPAELVRGLEVIQIQDGNGRVGRILNVLYLIRCGLLGSPVLYLSRAITK